VEIRSQGDSGRDSCVPKKCLIGHWQRLPELWRWIHAKAYPAGAELVECNYRGDFPARTAIKHKPVDPVVHVKFSAEIRKLPPEKR
jgi:hypothetical protein